MSKILKWARDRYRYYTAIKYKFEFTGDLPEVIPNQTIFIIVEDKIPDSLVFKCPCGCHTDIYLNLLKDAKPRWHYRITKKNKINISPSVWRKVGCKSHFFFRDGRIDWV